MKTSSIGAANVVIRPMIVVAFGFLAGKSRLIKYFPHSNCKGLLSLGIVSGIYLHITMQAFLEKGTLSKAKLATRKLIPFSVTLSSFSFFCNFYVRGSDSNGLKLGFSDTVIFIICAIFLQNIYGSLLSYFYNRTPEVENLRAGNSFEILGLPSEITHQIFSYLDWEDLEKCQKVCRSWNEAIKSEVIFRAKNFLPYFQGGGLSNWSVTPLVVPRKKSIESLAWLSRANCFQHLPFAPRIRRKNRKFFVKTLPLPMNITQSPSGHFAKLYTINGEETLFFSGIRMHSLSLTAVLDSNFKGIKLYGNTSPFSPAIDHKQKIYFGSLTTTIQCMNSERQSIEWGFTDKQLRRFRRSPAIGMDEKVYFAGRNYSCGQSDDGILQAFDPKRIDHQKPQPLWEYKTSSLFESTPTLDKQGILYVGSTKDFRDRRTTTETGTFFAFDTKSIDLEDPQPLWSFPNVDIVSSPTIAPDGKVYIGSLDGKLYAFDPKTIDTRDPKPIWSFQAETSFYSAPIIDRHGRLFIISSGGVMYAFDLKAINPEKPEAIWSYGGIKNPRYSPLLDVFGRVFVTTSSMDLIAFDPTEINAKNPHPFWQFSAEEYLSDSNLLSIAPPVIDSNGRIYMFLPKNVLCIQPDYPITRLI